MLKTLAVILAVAAIGAAIIWNAGPRANCTFTDWITGQCRNAGNGGVAN